MKNPLKSLTVAGILIAAIVNCLPFFGIEVNEAATADFVDRAQAAWPEIVEAFGLIMALVGRWRANAPLSIAKKNV